MELKPLSILSVIYPANVLIVPYGIETQKVLDAEIQARVLIVPYGIETRVNR